MKLRDIFTIHGKLKRFEYASTGFLLFAIKYNIDRAVAYFGFDFTFHPGHYLFYLEDPYFIFNDLHFAYTLALSSIPFIALGTLMTLKRLRDAGLPKWMVAIFFWRMWSDYILHKIHYRVLNHIKNQTEKN